MAGADDFVPVGYRACADCGTFMLASIRSIRCESCRDIAASATAALELAASGGKILATRRPKRRRQPKRTPEQAERRKLWGQARQAALLRLARIHQPMYELLLAEEKAARGLDPTLDERQPLRQVG